MLAKWENAVKSMTVKEINGEPVNLATSAANIF